VDTTIDKIERLNIVLLGIGTLLGWLTALVHVPSFLLGGVIMLVNFWLLKKVVRTALTPPQAGSSGKARVALWFSVKGLFFLLLLSALFIRYPIQAESFIVGVSLLLLTCVIVTLSNSQTGSGGVSTGA